MDTHSHDLTDPTRSYPDQGTAILSAMEYGLTVRIDEAYRDLADRGYVADGDAQVQRQPDGTLAMVRVALVLNRVGVRYQWVAR